MYEHLFDMDFLGFHSGGMIYLANLKISCLTLDLSSEIYFKSACRCKRIKK